MTELSALVRFVHLAAAVLLVGSHAFLLFIALPAVKGTDRAAKPILDSQFKFHFQVTCCCLLVLFLSALLSLWLQLLNVSGTGSTSALVPFLTETLYGKTWLLRAALIITSGIFLIPWRKQSNLNSVLRLTAGLILTPALLTSITLSGHSAAADGLDLIVQIVMDGSHLLASGIWLGGLVPLFVFLSRCNQISNANDFMISRKATQRFSRLGLTCVAVLIITGAYNAWIQIGRAHV